MKDFHTLEDFNFKDKTVLLRVDINCPLDKGTLEIINDSRIRRVVPTVRELIGKQAKVVILAHQSRKGKWDFTSLEQHSHRLSKHLNSPVKYVDDVMGDKAKAAIKAIRPEIKVGLTLSLHDLQSLPGGESFAEAAWDEEFRHYLPYIEGDDFLGVQNYTRTQYSPQGQLPAPKDAELTQMQYEFYPEALEHVIRRVREDFKGDLIVTENGIAVSDDTRRVEFIRRAVSGVQNCIADGIPVKGYFYWSLMDNFEWQKGYSMTFGLIAVDRATMERTPKESLSVLGSYAR